jgi:hypothetical protein
MKARKMMARFDLSKYATVEERLRAFWSSPESADARIVTVNHSVDDKTLVFETRIYVSAGDQANNLPKVTGWASEANTDQFSLERAETSSIGRCLANWLWTGAKPLDGTPRPSRQEMQKVASDERDFVAEASKLTDVEGLRFLYAQAKAAGAPQGVLEKVKARGESLGSKDSGVGAGVSASSKKQ